MIRVTHFQRRPTPGAYSVERIFEDVRAKLPADVDVTLQINEHHSRGFAGRLKDAITARSQQGDVNHVLGDVHFMMSFLSSGRNVLTVLDCVQLERLSGLRRSVLWLFWYRIPVARAARITVISEFSKQQLLKWVDYPEARIDIIPPCLSDEFEFSPRKNRSRPRILHIGTTSNKNLSRVTKALKGLNVELAIVGHPSDEQRSELEAAGIEFSIRADLSREELVAEYTEADLLLFASTYEGFGMPVIEAQAVGRPVITSNICAMPEAAGDAAHLVDPFDVESIREGVKKIIDDSEYAQMLVDKGVANARRFTAERIAADYAEVYRRIKAEKKI